MNNFKKGFTLIELLVVVAIIGILASVVLVVLGDARGKGADTAVKSNLAPTHVQAALFYEDSSNGYDGVCSSVLNSLVIAAQKAYNGSSQIFGEANASVWNKGACHDSLNSWAAIVPLKGSASGSTLAWCVDSTGVSKQVTSNMLSDSSVCP